MKTQDEKLKELNENELQETNGGQTPVRDDRFDEMTQQPGVVTPDTPGENFGPTDTEPWMQAGR